MIRGPRFRRAGVAVLAVLAGAASLLITPSGAGAQSAPSAKPAIFHNGNWYLRDSLTSGSATSTFRYGLADDYPVMGDWNGDGTETVGIARRTQLPTGRYTFTWHLRDSNSAGSATVPAFTFPTGPGYVDSWGLVPIVGDWNGDGVDTVGLVQYEGAPNDGMQWLFRNSNTTGLSEWSAIYSRGLDTAVVGDWDGDGDDSIGVVRADRWLLSNGTSGGTADHNFVYGSDQYDEIPVPGDWDGDGDDTPAILRNVPPTDYVGGYERWLYRNANSGGSASGQITFGSDAQETVPMLNRHRRLSWK